MTRVTLRLQALAAADARRTDPTPEAVERGCRRLAAALAPPLVAAGSSAAAVGRAARVVALVALGLQAGTAPSASDASSSQPPLAAHLDPPSWSGRSRPRIPSPATPSLVVATAPPQRAAVPTRPRRTGDLDPLAAQVRALGRARRDLAAGHPRRALTTARTLLDDPASLVAPEARAVEAIASCQLGLPNGPALAEGFAARHADSPLRVRVGRACAE